MKVKNACKRIVRSFAVFVLSLAVLLSMIPVQYVGDSAKTASAAVESEGSIELGSATVISQDDMTFKFESPEVVIGSATDGEKLTVVSIMVDSGHFNLGKLELEGVPGLYYQGTIKNSSGDTKYVSSTGDKASEMYTDSNDYTSITITGEDITVAAVEDYIKNITFTQESKEKSQTVSAAVSDVEIEDMAVIVNPDGQLHFYEFVPYLEGDNNPKNGNTWQNAYALAKQRSFNGLKGYLATITSDEEQQFIVNTLGTQEGWIGGTRAVYNKKLLDYIADNINNFKVSADYKNFSRPEADGDTYRLPEDISGVPETNGNRSKNYYWNNTQDSTLGLKTWFWVCGPEAGQPFYYGHNGNYTRGVEVADAYWGIENYNTEIKENYGGVVPWNSYFIPTEEDEYTPYRKTFYQLNYASDTESEYRQYSQWNNNEPNDTWDREMFVTYAYQGIANGRWNDWGNRRTHLNGDPNDNSGASGYYVEYSYYKGGLDDDADASDVRPIIKDIKVINVYAYGLNIDITNNTTGEPEEMSPTFDPSDGKSEKNPYVVEITVENDTDTIDLSMVPTIVDSSPDMRVNITDYTGQEKEVGSKDYSNVPISVGYNLLEVAYDDPNGDEHFYYVLVTREDKSIVPTVSIDPYDLNDPEHENVYKPVVTDNNASKAYDGDMQMDNTVRQIITVDHDTEVIDLNPTITLESGTYDNINFYKVDGPGYAYIDEREGKFFIRDLTSTPMDTVVVLEVIVDNYLYTYYYTVVRDRGEFSVEACDPNVQPYVQDEYIDGPTEDVEKRDSTSAVPGVYYDIYVPTDYDSIVLNPDEPSGSYFVEVTRDDTNGVNIMDPMDNDGNYLLDDIIANTQDIENDTIVVTFDLMEDNDIETNYIYRIHRMSADIATVTTYAEDPENPDTSFPPVIEEGEKVETENDIATHVVKTYDVPVTIYVPYEETSVEITPKLDNKAATILKDEVNDSEIASGAKLINNLSDHEGSFTIEGLLVEENSIVRVPVESYDRSVIMTYVYTVIREPKADLNNEFNADATNGDDVPENQKHDGIDGKKTVDEENSTIYYDVNVDYEIKNVDVELEYDKDLFAPDLESVLFEGSADGVFDENGIISITNLVPLETEKIMVTVNSKTGSQSITYIVTVTRADEATPTPEVEETQSPTKAPTTTNAPSATTAPKTTTAPTTTKAPTTSSATGKTNQTDDGTVPGFTLDGQEVSIDGGQIDLSGYITNPAGADEIVYHCCAHSIVAIDKNGVVRAMRSGRSFVHVIIKSKGKFYDYTVRIRASKPTEEQYYGTLITENNITYEVMDDGSARVSSLNYKNNNKGKVTIPDTISDNGTIRKVTAIAPYAFIRNKKIKQLILGANIQTVGNTSFAGMTGFKKFVVSADNQYVKTFKKGNNAHMLLSKDGKVMLGMAGCRKSVKIPNTVETINEYACAVNRMNKLVIGANVKKIYPCAFAHDAKLKRVQFKGAVPEMSFNCILDKMNYKKGRVFVPKKYYKNYKQAFKSAVKRKQFLKLKFLKKK